MPYPQVVADLLVGETGDLNIADGTDSGFTASLDLSNLTADRTLTLPDSDADIGLTTDSVGTDEIDLSITPTWTGAHTFNPASNSTSTLTVQNASSQNLLEIDTTNGKVVIRQPGGTAGTDEMQVYHNGVGAIIDSKSGDVLALPASNRLKVRQSGGTSGADEVDLLHNGTNAVIETHSGRIILLNGSESVYFDASSNEFSPNIDNTIDLGSSSTRFNELYMGGNIRDSNNNETLAFNSVASAVNHLQAGNAATGNPATLSAVGGDTNIGLELSPKGSGNVRIGAAIANTSGTQLLATSPSSAYSPSNVTTDRTYDANSTTQAELADVLGTLIADLQTHGLIG